MILLGLIFFWLASPQSNQWENAGNWSPVGPPSQNDRAIFNGSSVREIELTQAPTVSSLEFNGLHPFRLKIEPLAFFLLAGPVVSARTPEIVLNGAQSGSPAQMEAGSLANLGAARIILKGVSQGNGAKLTVRGNAGTARIYVNAGSYLLFDGEGNAGESQILAKPGIQGMYGGQIYFYGDSQAEKATIILTGRDSALQAQDHNSGTITVGHLSGTGAVFLGANTLVIKRGNFNGTIDGGTLAFEADSILTVHVGRMMTTSGAVVLGGTLEVYFAGQPVIGYPYRLFSVNGSKSGEFEAFRFPALPIAPHFKSGFVGNDYLLTIDL